VSPRNTLHATLTHDIFPVVPLSAAYYLSISQVEDRTVGTCTNHVTARRGLSPIVLFAPAVALLLAACQQETVAKAPEVRPVRTMIVEKSELGEVVALTGHIQAENEATLAFRIAGRIGDRIEPDQVLAKLDPQNELNGLRSAQANLAAA
jgi:multidrug efflux pump subunit AcrA (membrane-fusion protein)